MKNKKSNAMWGVTLVVVIGTAFFLNATNFLTKPLLPEAPKQSEAQGSVSASQTRNELATQVKSRETNEEGAPIDSGIPSKPAIFKAKAEIYKPTYNETSTSSQWYRDENVVNEKGEKVREERGF